MAREITITDATGYDATRIARLLNEWFTVSAIEWPKPSSTQLVGWVLNVIDGGYVVIAEADGRLYGVGGIEPFYMPWNRDELVMKDSFFYVQPAHRKRGVADGLLTALKLYCVKRELPLIMGIISGTNTEKLDRYYQIRGGKYAGGTMVFGLPAKEG